MIRKKRQHNNSAFTLVEVAMASGVLALALVGMIQVIISGSEMLDVSRKQTIAMQIIHGQVENIRLRDWNEVLALTSPLPFPVAVDAGDNNATGYKFIFGPNLPTIAKGFKCNRTITDVRTDLKQVTFTVTWTGNTGRSYTRKGSTYVGKNGLYVTYQRS